MRIGPAAPHDELMVQLGKAGQIWVGRIEQSMQSSDSLELLFVEAQISESEIRAPLPRRQISQRS